MFKKFLSRKLVVAVGYLVGAFIGVDVSPLIGAVYIGAQGVVDAAQEVRGNK